MFFLNIFFVLYSIALNCQNFNIKVTMSTPLLSPSLAESTKDLFRHSLRGLNEIVSNASNLEVDEVSDAGGGGWN